MNTMISDEFVSSLIGTVPDELLPTIREKLIVFLDDYSIEKKETEIVPYLSYIPKELVKYLATVKISGGSNATLSSYKLQLENFFKAVNRPVKEVTGDDIVLYLARYKDMRKVKNCSLDQYRIILNAFFEWCVDEEIISKNPCKNVKPIKYWKEKETPLTEYQIESVRSNCATSRDLAIIDFLLSTGCRVSEILPIKVSDIDFTNNRVDIVGKGNKKRTVYISGKCLHSLKKYLDSRSADSPLLFPKLRRPYGQMTKDGIEKMIRELGIKSDVTNLHPHLFRKTMATNALKRGMDIVAIQKMLGHENIETTMRYINISQEDIQNAHKRFVS